MKNILEQASWNSPHMKRVIEKRAFFFHVSALLLPLHLFSLFLYGSGGNSDNIVQ